jgi:hypothetical protein
MSFVPTPVLRHLHVYSFCFADEAPSYAEQHVCGEFGHFRPWHDDNTGMEQLGKYCIVLMNLYVKSYHFSYQQENVKIKDPHVSI